MGSDNGSAAEKPVHAVHVGEYYLDRYLVSNAEFFEFSRLTGYLSTAELTNNRDSCAVAKEQFTWRSFFTPSRAEHPVVLVSWYDANAFAAWCGKRLPTEAEWEKASRGGLEDCLFPWGNELPSPQLSRWAQIRDSGEAPPTAPVSSSQVNSLGLHDMSGNVWQWCADWFAEDYYVASNGDDPQGPDSGQYRVRRGGAWNVRESFRLRCSNRGAMTPGSSWPNIGFRCAWSGR